MNRKRERFKGRRESGSFLALPHDCLNHENFINLSPHSVKLLVDLSSQYKGSNNGDLCLTWSMMEKRGWRSQSTLDKCRRELLHFGWIELTRQGGRNQASLYAITWRSVDECKGKLDLKETKVASGKWKTPKSDFSNSKN